jgi:predicted acetyltransferase
VYRRAGYERAGHTYMVNCRLRSVAPVDRSSTLRRGTTDDEPALEELERRRSRSHDGNIDRTPFMWRRTRDTNPLSRETFVVEEADGITGYVRVRQTRPQGNVQLSLKDVVATTPGAARRILAFLADHASQIEDASWFGHPSDPLQSVADTLCFDVRVCDVWMLRITHVESALTARGYPSAVSAIVHLDLEDDLCPANAGPWTLHIDEGVPTVERGGEGRVRLHVRDLAPIYSGYKHPLALRATQRIEGTDDDLRTLGAVFAGTAPWMQETF